MPRLSKDPGKMRVQKSISMDYDLMSRVIEEAENMNRDFSSTISVLITMGLGVRQIQQEREKESITAAAKRMS